MIRTFAAMTFYLVLTILSPLATAHAATLADLIATNGSITDGTLTFDHFSFVPILDTCDPDCISVTGIPGGLAFTLDTNADPNQLSSGRFGYQVHSVNGVNAGQFNLNLLGLTGGGSLQMSIHVSDLSILGDPGDTYTLSVGAGGNQNLTVIASDAVTNLQITNTLTNSGGGVGHFGPTNNLFAQQRFLLTGPSAPILPPSPAVPFDFPLFVTPSTTIYVDPAVAIGYDYAIMGGINIASVTLPSVSGSNYDLCLWNGASFVCGTSLSAGVPYHFGGNGVDRFRILGINPNAALDPTNPQAFVTGLTFTGSGAVDLTMTPITNAVPEPSTWLLLVSGLAGIGVWRRGEIKAAVFAVRRS